MTRQEQKAEILLRLHMYKGFMHTPLYGDDKGFTLVVDKEYEKAKKDYGKFVKDYLLDTED